MIKVNVAATQHMIEGTPTRFSVTVPRHEIAFEIDDVYYQQIKDNKGRIKQVIMTEILKNLSIEL